MTDYQPGDVLRDVRHPERRYRVTGQSGQALHLERTDPAAAGRRLAQPVGYVAQRMVREEGEHGP